MTRRHKKSRPAGVLLLEVMFGLAMMVTIITMLAVSIGSYRQGMRRLAAHRAAIHLAERVLTRMEQDGSATQLFYADSRIKIQILPQSDAAPRGQQWVRVSVNYVDGDASLIGLVRSKPEARP